MAVTKREPIEHMAPEQVLEVAQKQLLRLRGQGMSSILGPHPRGPRTDDPSNPPPDPAKVQDLANLWVIVQRKAATARHMGARTVPLTPGEAFAANRALGVSR